jgi:hypothetical protein
VIGTDCRQEAVYTGTLSSDLDREHAQRPGERVIAGAHPGLLDLHERAPASSPFLSRSLSTEPVIDLNFLNMRMTRSLPRGQSTLLFRRGQETTVQLALT